MRHAIAVLWLVLGLAACADDPWPGHGPLAPGCALVPQAAVKLTESRNFMLAPVSLNGQTVTMVVDTGAEASTVTPAAAARLGLPPDGLAPSMLRGVGGMVRSQNVRVHALALDGHVLRSDHSLSVGELPPFPGVVPPVAGLLGTDVLDGFEVELDLPARRLALYTAVGCADYAPWPGGIVTAFPRRRGGLVFVAARVDGRRVQALVDSGARTTLVTRATALALGLTEAALADGGARNGVGIGMGSIAFRQHRFAELGLPGDLEHDMTANIADLHLPGVEMLLGADYLGARQVWISYSTGRLFLRR